MINLHCNTSNSDYSSFFEGSYRYAFQGQERDDEIKGRGNSYNYTYRMHDSRLGRFFAVDPLVWKFPFYSSYQFSSNSPIFVIELEGLESSYIINYSEKHSITLTKNEKNQLVVDMNEVRRLPDEYQAYIQFLSTSSPHDANPSPGSTVKATCDECESNITGVRHGVFVTIPKGATVMTDEDIQAMNQKKNSETSNIHIDKTPTQSLTGSTSPIIPSTPKKETVSHKKLNTTDLNNINKKFSGASIFSAKMLNNGRHDWEVTTDKGMMGSIGNIMKAYSNYDLSNVKVDVQLTIGRANKNENYSSQKGLILSNGIRNQLKKAGFKEENIHISTSEIGSQHGPGATFKIQNK
ncbi:MAG: hypothetical protein J0G96_13560 [Flavobacteriia bacterium]|nr:hypothetical protein [Flavobacteriia bacterium]OJX39601.1 MAG: hypothetical protein BGO87_11725 [Flavobacteriia bacterium 40-80]